MYLIVSLLLIVCLCLVIFFFSRYKTFTPNRIMVVHGSNSKEQHPKCIHGECAFIWPLIQSYEFLNLNPIPIDISFEGNFSEHGIKINMTSTFTLGISTEKGIMENAANHLLGLQHNQIEALAREIIIEKIQSCLGQIDYFEFLVNRNQFEEKLSNSVEEELAKVGLKLINMVIRDEVTDKEKVFLNSMKLIFKNKPGLEFNTELDSWFQNTLKFTIDEERAKRHLKIPTLTIKDSNGHPINNVRAIVSFKGGKNNYKFNLSDKEGKIILDQNGDN